MPTTNKAELAQLPDGRRVWVSPGATTYADEAEAEKARPINWDAERRRLADEAMAALKARWPALAWRMEGIRVCTVVGPIHVACFPDSHLSAYHYCAEATAAGSIHTAAGSNHADSAVERALARWGAQLNCSPTARRLAEQADHMRELNLYISFFGPEYAVFAPAIAAIDDAVAALNRVVPAAPAAEPAASAPPSTPNL
jgi:hypothetical protein